MVTSPVIDQAVWFGLSKSSSSKPTFAETGADVFLVEISNDLGNTWVTVDQAGPSDSMSVGGWFLQEITVSSFVVPTNQIMMRWIACDEGDGSVIEAAIDAFGAGNCESEEFLPADFNQDGNVDGLDLAVVLANWGQSNAGGDADGDGFTGAQDLAVVLASWTVGG